MDTDLRSKAESSGKVDKLRGAIMYRNSNGRIGRWKNYARIVSYNYNGAAAGGDSPVVNIMAARVRNIPPMLAFNNPTFEVTYLSPLPSQNSEVAASVGLGRAWADEQVQDVMSRGLLDWPTFGRAAFFVGFEAGSEAETLEARKSASAAVEQYGRQTAARRVIEKARSLLGINDKDKPLDPAREVKTFKMMLNKRVFVERVSPFNFAIDPCAESPQDATFMARRIFLPYSRARLMFGDKCPKAESLANAAIYTDEGESDPFGNPSPSNTMNLPESVMRVEAWEMWDIEDRTTTYISNKGEELGSYPWKSAHPGYPFVLLDWDEVADSPIPEGMCASLHTLNNEINELRRRELAEAGKAFGVTILPETISAATEKAIIEAKDGSVIKVKAEEFDLIKTLDRAFIPPDFWTLENRILANMDEASRTNAQQSGAMNAVRRSASEVNIAAQGTDATMSFRQLQVEQAAGQIAERMLAAMMATFDEDIALAVVNQDEELAAVGTLIDYPWRPTDHGGFVRITVASGSMASVAKDVERQQLLGLRGLLAEEPHFDKVAFDTHLLSVFNSIKDPSKFIIEPEPQAQVQDEGLPPNGGPPLPPEPQNGMMPPMEPDLGIGSGMPSADLMAATLGGIAPGTGPNGAGGSF